MVNNLKEFIGKYSKDMTVAMLLDLCSATGYNPSDLIDSTLLATQKKKSKTITTDDVYIFNHSIPEDIDATKYFTATEVANIFNLKIYSIWKWIREGKINAVKFGRVYRIKGEDIKKCIEARMTGV